MKTPICAGTERFQWSNILNLVSRSLIQPDMPQRLPQSQPCPRFLEGSLQALRRIASTIPLMFSQVAHFKISMVGTLVGHVGRPAKKQSYWTSPNTSNHPTNSLTTLKHLLYIDPPVSLGIKLISQWLKHMTVNQPCPTCFNQPCQWTIGFLTE